MAEKSLRRDYGLLGLDSQQAEKNGLVGGQWYSSPIPRKQLKELMRRNDRAAIIDTAIWFIALAISAFCGYWYWGTWAAVPSLFVYGVLYGSASDSRWHECGHGTAFKTRWLNDVVYHIACFMILREPTVWRWSHARHHTDTIIVGRDPEIAVPLPPDLFGLFLNLFALKTSYHAFGKLFLHASGQLTPEEKTFIPDIEHPKVYRTACIYLGIFTGVIAWCVAAGSIEPAFFIALPTLYGGWLSLVFGLTQHAGLCEDVLDHRLNSRTVYMNPVFRFLYWNMNYHIEHHMFPMVPFHALPDLHEAIKADCPRAYHGLLDAYREIIPALLKQISDPGFHVERSLPGLAQTKESARVAVPAE